MTKLQGIIEKNNAKCIKLGLRRVWRAEMGSEKATRKAMSRWGRALEGAGA